MKKNIFLFFLTALFSVTNISILKSMDLACFSPKIDTRLIKDEIATNTDIINGIRITYYIPRQIPEYNYERSYESGKDQGNRVALLQSPDTYKQMCPLGKLLCAIKNADIITTEELLSFRNDDDLPIDTIKNEDGMTPINFFASCLQNKRLYKSITQQRNALSIGVALINNAQKITYLTPDKEKKYAIARLGETYELYKNTRHGARAAIAHEILSRINKQIIDQNAARKHAPRVYTARPAVDQKG